MTLEIKTKFNRDDIVYGFHNGLPWAFRISDIDVCYSLSSNRTSVWYDTTAITDSELTFNQRFEEHELHTKEELKAMVETLLK